jgi:hypothetical protein
MKYFFGTAAIVCITLFTTSYVFASHFPGHPAGSSVSPTNPGGSVSPTNPGGSVSPTNPGGSISPTRLPQSVKIENPIKATSIVLLFQTLIDIVLIFAVPIIVFFIIYAGFLYVTARGNASTIEKAHMALLYALIGGLLILGARVLIEVIQGTVDSIIKK